jgi:rhodanese-related sulfurtransferase
MRLAGQKTNFVELLKPKYIGSGKGSSLAELQKAAEDHGLYTKAVVRITSKELSRCDYPIILHMKLSVKSQDYDHYALFLGTQNGKVKILDPPNPMKLVSFAELAPQWDGTGLIVSAEPIDLGTVFAQARRRFILYAAIAISAILVLRWTKRWLPEAVLNSRAKLFGLSIGQGAAFATVGLLCGMLYHFANDEGLLANAKATSAIQRAHQGNFIPKISERQVQRLLDADAIFIDARFARDYEAGHLEDAISVPVDANDVKRRKATAHISKDARIVLYCQSAGCKFAETVAFKLMEDGFSNICIFRGGWAEWVAKNGKPKEAAL